MSKTLAEMSIEELQKRKDALEEMWTDSLGYGDMLDPGAYRHDVDEIDKEIVRKEAPHEK